MVLTEMVVIADVTGSLIPLQAFVSSSEPGKHDDEMMMTTVFELPLTETRQTTVIICLKFV